MPNTKKEILWNTSYKAPNALVALEQRKAELGSWEEQREFIRETILSDDSLSIEEKIFQIEAVKAAGKIEDNIAAEMLQHRSLGSMAKAREWFFKVTGKHARDREEALATAKISEDVGRKNEAINAKILANAAEVRSFIETISSPGFIKRVASCAYAYDQEFGNIDFVPNLSAKANEQVQNYFSSFLSACTKINNPVSAREDMTSALKSIRDDLKLEKFKISTDGNVANDILIDVQKMIVDLNVINIVGSQENSSESSIELLNFLKENIFKGLG